MTASRFRVLRTYAAATLLAGLAAFTVRGDMHAQGSDPCEPPNGNAVLCENQQPGNPASEWDVAGAGDETIQGFATDISVNQGQTVTFKISTPASSYTIDIYRMGYYSGMGARKVATVIPSALLPQSQPACLTDSLTGLTDCGNWEASASWPVPADATSGIYFAKLVRPDTGGASHIVFVVRNDASHADLLFQTSDTTWQAYNQYGGNSLYVGGPGVSPGRAYKVSYNRPFTTRGTSPEDWVFNAEYPMVRWLEANGYDTSYTTGIDSDRNGALILNHKVFLSVGHDEYWSGTQRANVEAARGAGVHLAFFSGNEVFWKTRWESAISADGTQHRTLVSYKETHADAKIDPLPNEWTGTWADPRFSPPADGGRPQNALTGTLFTVNCCTGAITVPAADGQLRFWRNTPIASLAPGGVATLPDGTLGYEWDSDVDNGFRPAGLLRMSHTSVTAPMVLADYGSTYSTAPAEHSLTLYRHASGALVFGAGTVQWSWGLDGTHDRGSLAPDVSMQQATINLFADMGVQPLSVQSGLLTASSSADTLAPSSTIVFPANGATVTANSTVVITGHSTDAGGGHIAGVEVSVDGGTTWRLASGRDTWTYTWHAGAAGSADLRARAVDDSGNLEQPSSGFAVTVRDWEVTGPGGPILVVTSAANPFTLYYAEILRAEGLNAFSIADIATVNAGTLAQHDVVILGEMPVDDTQVAMFSDWVAAGGNLIAMRPDARLASLLGLTATASTLADAYLAVDTSAAPGAGIVGQTMQFHGTADRYTLAGAAAVATLYSNATTSTSEPAVTLRSVGNSGGQVAAFTYDLARSVVYTRQGNPLWSGQERDGQSPVRSDDLFFGDTSTSYLDLSKVAIPQADEQQRLLANLIGLMNSDRKPLPRFWYLPRGVKAAVVMTGDDHGHNGTAGRFDIYNANSTPGCSVADWECVRATSYMYANSPIAPGEVTAYRAQGFEIGVHMRMSGPDECNNFTPSSVFTDYTDQLAEFAGLFPGTGPIRTNRTHCIVWSDYDSQAVAASAHGVRFDTNYYYWPAEWVNDVPGVFTGSGMPMRFAKADGTTIDAYQAATQLTDESGQTYPSTIDALLDRALGPEGYYGAFVANMHTDLADHAGSVAIVASAQSRGVPIVSAEQMLEWIDGRNTSTVDSITWNGSALGFTIAQGTGANGLQTMLPAASGGASLTSITRGGSPVSFSIQVIKGVAYAMFSSTSGSYLAEYAVDVTAPAISAVSVAPGCSSAGVTWTTSEASTSAVSYGTSAGSLTSSASSSAATTNHGLHLTGLISGTTYHYRVTSVDSAGNSTTIPALAGAPAQFTTDAGNCHSIWTPAQAPSVDSLVDTNPVEVGLRFRASVGGTVTAIRFYKGAANTGVHRGNLWSNTGTLLGTVVFANETASGWQEATLATPVTVTANTTYVVSYHTNAGGYSADPGYFATSGVINGPLQALADGVDGPNGVFVYGPSAFPTETLDSHNYWVDVVFAIAPDTAPPTVVGVTPAPNVVNVSTAASVTATFNENIDAASITGSTVVLRDPSNAVVAATVTLDSGLRTVTLAPSAVLDYSTTYTARISGGSSGVKDTAGNALAADSTWSFTTAAAPPPGVNLVDTTVGDFAAGTADSGTYISQTADGELTLAPSAGAEFSGTTLPAGWSATPWAVGGAAVVADGKVSADGARVALDPLLPSGQSLEFVATFSTDTQEHVGFGENLDGPLWAIFSTSAGGGLYARTHDGVVPTNTLIPGTWLGAPHRYRIDWSSSAVTFFIDGTQVAVHPGVAPNMRPILSDLNIGGGALSVDWMRLAPYATAATFTSRVLDAGAEVVWSAATWTAQTPAGTTLAISARFGNTAVPDGTWTSFAAVTSSGAPLLQTSRYVQYQATLTGNAAATPILETITFSAPDPTPPPAVSLSIDNVTVTEGNGSSHDAGFVVTLSAVSGQTVTVSYATVNGSALANADYAPTSGVLTFAPGTVTQTIEVPILTDTQVEATESFTVELSGAVNATISDAVGIGTILDDDAVAPAFTLQPVDRTVAVGLNTTLTVAATGNPAPTYRWQVSFNGGSSWTNLTNGGPVAGATSTTLSISGVQADWSGFRYRSVATSSAGTAASAAATLTVTIPSITVTGDFDGDGRADVTSFRPADGTWQVRSSKTGTTTTTAWGTLGDLPVPADYDGDGKTDIAIFRPSTGFWYLRYSGSGNADGIAWGTAGDVPVPGDYDGDGKTDVAIFRPSDGGWYFRYSRTGTANGVLWGAAGDVPVPGDYDGDGKTDVAIFRPSDGVWYVRFSASGTANGYAWGTAGDLPVQGDYDGDGRTDIAVFRASQSAWYILYSGGGAPNGFLFGGTGDVPVTADYDGDGRTDLAVFRPSNGTWYLWQSASGTVLDIQGGS